MSHFRDPGMANTIPALKRSFLSSQVRVLNTPLELGEDWRDAGPSPDEGDLKDAVVDEVLRKGERRGLISLCVC